MSVSVPADPAIAGGNLYPKYTARNPIARLLVDRFLVSLLELARQSGAKQVHEVGCGEGFLCTMLAQHGFTVRGSDIASAPIATARERAAELALPVTSGVADLYDLAPDRDGAELVVCCEVLEHVAEPVRAVELLARLARPHLIVSVPREPLWRVLNLARGRYWCALGNTPGHLQHWSTASFLALLAQQVEVRVVRTPLPGPWRCAGDAERFPGRSRPGALRMNRTDGARRSAVRPRTDLPRGISASAAPESEGDPGSRAAGVARLGMTWSTRTVGRVAGWLVVALALGFLGHQLWQSNPWSLAGAHAADLALAVGMGTLAYGLAGFLLAEAWRHLLGPGPAEAEPWRHRALYGRTQIAKYLPGNCFHLIGRQVLGRRLGHGHGTLVLASLAEAVSLLLVAGTLALPLVWSRIERTLGMPAGWLVLATAGVVVVLTCLNARRVGEWRARVALHADGPIGSWAPRVLQAGLLHAAFFVVAGLALWGVAAAIRDPAAPGLGPTAAVSSMAMAWWLGFVAPGVSAGAGVREAVLVLALAAYVADDAAMLIALALRLITTFGDLLFFALCVVMPWGVSPDQEAGRANRRPIPPILKYHLDSFRLIHGKNHNNISISAAFLLVLQYIRTLRPKFQT